VVAIANAVRMSLDAARALEGEGISAEVIDPRTLVPLDWDTIFASVEKTGRLVIVDPAPLTCSVASEISATVSETCGSALARPPLRVTAPDVHIPFSPPLEKALLPSRERIADALRTVVGAEVVSGT
jgi:pyruvate dehydrogenase E1 component beta subunit